MEFNSFLHLSGNFDICLRKVIYDLCYKSALRNRAKQLTLFECYIGNVCPNSVINAAKMAKTLLKFIIKAHSDQCNKWSVNANNQFLFAHFQSSLTDI